MAQLVQAPGARHRVARRRKERTMKSVTTADAAFAVCEEIAKSRARATAPTPYGDGYRAAAEHIAAAVRAERHGEPPTALEQDLRDAESEARTFARVINAAVCVVEGTGEETEAAEAVRALVHTFFSDADLPPQLRHRERSSSTRLSERPGARTAPRARAQAGGVRRSSLPPLDPSA
jgi:hypothetical protein